MAALLLLYPWRLNHIPSVRCGSPKQSWCSSTNSFSFLFLITISFHTGLVLCKMPTIHLNKSTFAGTLCSWCWVAIPVLQKWKGLKKYFRYMTLSHGLVVAPRRGRKFSPFWSLGLFASVLLRREKEAMASFSDSGGHLRDLLGQVGEQPWLSKHAYGRAPVVVLQHGNVLGRNNTSKCKD